MLYLLDTADLDAIRHCNEFYPLDGVTTNPSILARSGGDFWQTVCAIRAIIGPEKALHVQTRGVTAEQMVEEGKLLREKLAALPYPEARGLLMSIRGVGPKVADCVLLFGADKKEAFPMDVWMKRAMQLLPGVTPEIFGDAAGIAQQYIFH